MSTSTTDILGLDELLSPDELALRDKIATFVGERITSNIEAWYEEGVCPRELARAFDDLGVLRMHLECAGSRMD